MKTKKKPYFDPRYRQDDDGWIVEYGPKMSDGRSMFWRTDFPSLADAEAWFTKKAKEQETW